MRPAASVGPDPSSEEKAPLNACPVTWGCHLLVSLYEVTLSFETVRIPFALQISTATMFRELLSKGHCKLAVSEDFNRYTHCEQSLQVSVFESFSWFKSAPVRRSIGCVGRLAVDTGLFTLCSLCLFIILSPLCDRLQRCQRTDHEQPGAKSSDRLVKQQKMHSNLTRSLPVHDAGQIYSYRKSNLP